MKTITTTTISFIRSLSVLSLLFILHSLLGPRVLYAMPHDFSGVERYPMARQLASTEPARVHIEGEVKCSADCTIEERQTGKTYHLTGENEPVRKLFNNGNKNVAVEGTLSNETTVDVQTSKAL